MKGAKGMDGDGVEREILERLAAETERVRLYEAFACAVELYAFGDVLLRSRDEIVMRVEEMASARREVAV